MPKKKNEESQADQSKRFQRFAQDMIDAGELDPIEAEKGIDLILEKSKENQEGS